MYNSARLHEYGNTKEGDIVNYGMQEFDCSSKTMKKAIKRMVNEGRICFVVHGEIEPPVVYVSIARRSEDAQALLDEEAAVAERTIKEKYSRTS